MKSTTKILTFKLIIFPLQMKRSLAVTGLICLKGPQGCTLLKKKGSGAAPLSGLSATLRAITPAVSYGKKSF